MFYIPYNSSSQHIYKIEMISIIMDNIGTILLTGVFGRKVFQDYSSLVDNKYHRKGQLCHNFNKGGWRYDLIIDDEGTIQGCGSISSCLIDEVLQKYGYKTVDLHDFESFTNMENPVIDALKGMHLNFGLVLVAGKFDFSREDKYHKGTKKLKKDLQNQLKQRQYDLAHPVYIPFSSLELETDDKSPFGLRFNILDTAFMESSESFMGKDTTEMMDSSILHIKKARRQGIYNLKFYANTVCINPDSYDDFLKAHHRLGIDTFDKMSHSYGRILAVPRD